MPEWIAHTHAAFVVAAYAVAALFLLGLGLASWIAYIKAARQWRALSQPRGGNPQ